MDDRRYSSKQRADGAMFPKKIRIDGSPSQSPPPFGAPGWAVNKDWSQQHTGEYTFMKGITKG